MLFQEPLLIPEAAQPSPAAPLQATALWPPTGPSSVRRAALPQSIGSMPFLARSVRLFPNMFSPHSLASPPTGGRYNTSLSDEDFASSVNQRQRWPGTTPASHPRGIMQTPGQANGTANSAHNHLSRQDSDQTDAEDTQSQ